MRIFINNKMYIQKRDLGILWKQGFGVLFEEKNYNLSYFSENYDDEFIPVLDEELKNAINRSESIIDYVKYNTYTTEELARIKKHLENEVINISRKSVNRINKDILEEEIFVLINKITAIGSIILDKEGCNKIKFPDNLDSYFNKRSILSRVLWRK